MTLVIVVRSTSLCNSNVTLDIITSNAPGISSPETAQFARNFDTMSLIQPKPTRRLDISALIDSSRRLSVTESSQLPVAQSATTSDISTVLRPSVPKSTTSQWPVELLQPNLNTGPSDALRPTF